MYVGRTLAELENMAYTNWTLDELAYHIDTMNQFQPYLNAQGQQIRQKVQAEIDARGGFPHYGGDYEHPSACRYD
ncbi:MAG: hypothetical protein ACXVC1_10050 [Tumebacillaceae bacterium]